MSTTHLTQHLTIHYEYITSSDTPSNSQTATLNSSLAILPPLILKKSASTTHAYFHKPFEYHIQFANPSDYPMCIYFFDRLFSDTCYQPNSFLLDHLYPMKPIYFDHWIDLGVLAPHTDCVVSYTAQIRYPLLQPQIVSQAEALYYFVLPKPLIQLSWFHTESNLCCI